MERQTGITSMEQELQGIERQNQILKRKTQSMVSELGSKKMTLDGLRSRLETLEKENRNIKADTYARRTEKERFENLIKRYKKKIEVLKNSSQLSAQEKEKRIQELKEEIRTHLEMGLK